MKFTDDEYARELELHHIKILPKESPARAYRKTPPQVKANPKSGVFRDFVQYGVYPARVVVQQVVISIPFILKNLSREQIEAEIKNQNPSLLQKKPLVFKDKLEAAYALILSLRNRGKLSVHYTPPLKRFMVGLNLYFARGEKFVISPPRRKDLLMLLPLISEKAALNEIRLRAREDPDRWNLIVKDKEQEIVSLLGELMTTHVYASDLREVVEWFKKAFLRMQLYKFLDDILKHYTMFVSTIPISFS